MTSTPHGARAAAKASAERDPEARMSRARTIRADAGEGGEGRADGLGHALVELVGVGAADVVGLEDGGSVHDRSAYRRRFRRLFSATTNTASPATTVTSLDDVA